MGRSRISSLFLSIARRWGPSVMVSLTSSTFPGSSASRLSRRTVQEKSPCVDPNLVANQVDCGGKHPPLPIGTGLQELQKFYSIIIHKKKVPQRSGVGFVVCLFLSVKPLQYKDRNRTSFLVSDMLRMEARHLNLAMDARNRGDDILNLNSEFL